ncbi:MAG: helix-turn-helix domain-containing protein [Bosea sp. (in: a-proteobacteria)]
MKSKRSGRGWTLEQFAAASGVSRAMISKIERGEVSPTASVLARLAAGLGTSMASLFPPPAASTAPLSRWEDQSDWRDPASGYVRRNVSPSGAVAEIVYVTFPPKARVVFDNYTTSKNIEQQVWVLEGEIEMTIGEAATLLGTGDCLLMRLDQPITFHNPGNIAARYAVILSKRPS